MNGSLLVLAVLFGIAGHQEARRFARQYGSTPWGWDPWVWAVIMFLSWVVGVILLAVAERQGRRTAGRRAASGQQVYSQPVYTQALYSQPAMATSSAGTGYGTFDQPMATGPAPAAAGQLPAACWAVDPTGRNQYRWWDGNAWTAHVHTAGTTGQDPL